MGGDVGNDFAGRSLESAEHFDVKCDIVCVGLGSKDGWRVGRGFWKLHTVRIGAAEEIGKREREKGGGGWGDRRKVGSPFV